MGFATVLPMAVVMVAGPQFISAVILATGSNPRRNSAAFVAGAAPAIAFGVSLIYWIVRLVGDPGGRSHRSDTVRTVVDWVVLALLVALLVTVFARRRTSGAPRWMGRLQSAEPRFAFLLGLSLFLAFPTDIITMTTIGARLAREDLPWWKCLPFVLLTVLLVALPLLLLVALGSRALEFLPRLRTWMDTHSWVVNEIVILFFLAITVSGLGSGLARRSGHGTAETVGHGAHARAVGST